MDITLDDLADSVSGHFSVLSADLLDALVVDLLPSFSAAFKLAFSIDELVSGLALGDDARVSLFLGSLWTWGNLDAFSLNHGVLGWADLSGAISSWGLFVSVFALLWLALVSNKSVT